MCCLMMRKSVFIIYNCTRSRRPDPGLRINNIRVSRVEEDIHLGHQVNEDIYKFDASKCVTNFNRQCNMFFAHFKLTY